MFRISKDSPVYYLTSVAKDRLQVFKTAKLKNIACTALNEARTSVSSLIFAYVIMPDHLHALIGSQRKPSEVLRYVNGRSGRRVINYRKRTASNLHCKSLNAKRATATTNILFGNIIQTLS